jgi:hypothetical protein
MNLLEKLKAKFASKEKPEHLRRGELGECAAKKFLQKQGLKFLAANFGSGRGEIDLIFRDEDCLAFVEVKTRSSENWTRPVAAVDAPITFADGAGLFAPVEKSRSENPFRHRGGFAGRRRCARNPASAEHVRAGEALSLRLKCSRVCENAVRQSTICPGKSAFSQTRLCQFCLR